MICKYCKEDKQKIRAEHLPLKGQYQYRDERGLPWHGLICPDCFAPKVKRADCEPWDPRELHPDEHYDSDPITDRKCRKCKAFLTKSRYFFCNGCEVTGISQEFEGLGGFW